MEEKSLYGFKFRDVDRRRNIDGTRQIDIKQLWQRSHEILNLALLGHKQAEIAKILSISPQTVSNTLNSTLGLEAMAEKRKDRDKEYELLQEDIIDLTRKGLEVYNQILDNERESAKLRKETADTIILELSGLRVPTRIDSRSVHTAITIEELEEFKRRGIEAAKASGQLVEYSEKQ